MNVETAKKILAVAQGGGYFDGPIPDNEEELLAEGEFFYNHALTAKESGVNDPVVLEIISLGAPKATDGYVAETIPSSLLGPGKLPIPPQIEGEVPVMPFDLSNATDKQIRSLASQYNACLSRVIWQLSETLSEEQNLKHLRDAIYRSIFLKISTEARASGEKILRDELDFMAKENEEFKALDEQVRGVEKNVRDYKALKEIYQGNIDRLSREATLRDDEYKRSGGGR
jgi:hypothetical protein